MQWFIISLDQAPLLSQAFSSWLPLFFLVSALSEHCFKVTLSGRRGISHTGSFLEVNSPETFTAGLWARHWELMLLLQQRDDLGKPLKGRDVICRRRCGFNTYQSRAGSQFCSPQWGPGCFLFLLILATVGSKHHPGLHPLTSGATTPLGQERKITFVPCL